MAIPVAVVPGAVQTQKEFIMWLSKGKYTALVAGTGVGVLFGEFIVTNICPGPLFSKYKD